MEPLARSRIASKNCAASGSRGGSGSGSWPSTLRPSAVSRAMPHLVLSVQLFEVPLRVSDRSLQALDREHGPVVRNSVHPTDSRLVVGRADLAPGRDHPPRLRVLSP